jgi:hypothetical protein
MILQAISIVVEDQRTSGRRGLDTPIDSLVLYWTLKGHYLELEG